MSWRDRTRRLLPYAFVLGAGFLGAYLVAAFVLFPARLVPDDIEAPNVVGLLDADARRRLTTTGLTTRIGERVFHPTTPRGTVLEQAPAPGTMLRRGSPVVLQVSDGQRTGTVPDVAGLPAQQARATLESAGFDVSGIVEQRTDTGPRGIAITTDPPPGRALRLPAAVVLRVSAGPALISTPDVVGLDYVRARSLLEQLGMRVPAAESDAGTASPAGMVVRQAPAAGSRVRAGATVQLTVSAGGS